MHTVKVEILQRWTGVTFDFKPGDIVELPANDAQRLIAGGVCKPESLTKPAKPRPDKEQ